MLSAWCLGREIPERATLHPSTGKAPAKLMYDRNYKTRLPDMMKDPVVDRRDI